MKIELEEKGSQGRYVMQQGDYTAEMTFTRPEPRIMQINHTGVPREIGGKGIGLALVERAVADARAGGFRIKPVCSYAKAQFDKHPDWADLLA